MVTSTCSPRCSSTRAARARTRRGPRTLATSARAIEGWRCRPGCTTSSAGRRLASRRLRAGKNHVQQAPAVLRRGERNGCGEGVRADHGPAAQAALCGCGASRPCAARLAHGGRGRRDRAQAAWPWLVLSASGQAGQRAGRRGERVARGARLAAHRGAVRRARAL